MMPAYKLLWLLSVIFSLCSACAHQKEAQSVGDASGAAAHEVASAQLQAPTGLTARNVPGGFLISWNPSPQDPGIVTGYEVVRANVFSGPYQTVGMVVKGIFNFVDKTAKPENIYFYKVRAVAGNQYSLFSREASGEMPGTP